MDRRTLLKLLAATALSGVTVRRASADNLRVVVAGAGIVGASIAYHLARAGAAVTVVDGVGPASHASRGTFAWINATWAKQPRHYHVLNQDGLASWKTLQNDLDLPIRWRGSIEWFEDAERQARLVEQIAEQRQWGEPARIIQPDEMRVLEPGVRFGDAEFGAFSENDGAVDPVAATGKLLRAAAELGTSIRFPAKVTDVSLRNGRVVSVDTTDGVIATDRLVLATGAAEESARRFALSDIPQRSTPGVIAITAPTRRLIDRIIVAPGIHMHQRGDGRIVLGEQDGAPQTDAHRARLEGRPNDFPSEFLAAQHAGRLLAAARRFLPDIDGVEVDHVYIGWRPLPIDGHPVLGRSPERPDVYLAVMHSGVSLAPIVGQLAAYEIVEQAVVERLDAYRPGRTFENVERY